jgi:hypothetical protein
MEVKEGRRGLGAAAALIAGWYAFAWLVVRPLSGAPVVDSWLYQHAVTAFAHSGRLRFAGFTQAMPVGQVIYGLAWSRLFGTSAPSFDLSVAVLGMAGALVLYALVRRCGAEAAPALLATGLLICNPCYLFLSFSFMTEVPFLAPFLACHLAFACADGSARAQRWLWLAASLATAAFTVRPFGGAALIGCSAALIIYDRELWRGSPQAPGRVARRIVPFACAFVVCAAFWILLTREMRPWGLAYGESRALGGFLLVPAMSYLKLWVLWPLLYLGLVLSPLALVHAALRWRRAIVIALGFFVLTVIVTAFDDHFTWAIPDCRCFGGWPGALTLMGMPQRLRWPDVAGIAAGWIVAVVGSMGAAGLCVAAAEVMPRVGRSAAALMLAAAVYWMAALPLWFFADRYYLLLVPAGCLLLALAPLPRARGPVVVAAAMTAVMGLLSLGGTYAYQRGAQAVLEARDALLASGVPRAAIDAGYPLNGQDLYRYPQGRPDTFADERDIPMITSRQLSLYTIAAAPVAGTEVVRRFSWPGPFGLGARPLYVLRLKPLRANQGPQGSRSSAR